MKADLGEQKDCIHCFVQCPQHYVPKIYSCSVYGSGLDDPAAIWVLLLEKSVMFSCMLELMQIQVYFYFPIINKAQS